MMMMTMIMIIMMMVMVMMMMVMVVVMMVMMTLSYPPLLLLLLLLGRASPPISPLSNNHVRKIEILIKMQSEIELWCKVLPVLASGFHGNEKVTRSH